nr:hypothetical protein [uncultured Moellerella sp.]
MAWQGHVIHHTNHIGGDRRIILVSATPSGIRLIESLLEAAKQHEEVVLAPLDAQKIQLLKQILLQLIEMHRLRN